MQRMHPKAKSHTHKGMFVKADAKELTYKGIKGPEKEHTIKVDDKTKVTLDGKDAKLADLKADNYLVIADEGGWPPAIAASTDGPSAQGRSKQGSILHSMLHIKKRCLPRPWLHALPWGRIVTVYRERRRSDGKEHQFIRDGADGYSLVAHGSCA